MRGGGQGEHGVVADLLVVADDVDVEGTRAEAFGSYPAGAGLDALGRREQVRRVRPVATISTAFR